MKQKSKKYRKQMIEVIGSAYEFVLKLGAKARYQGYLKDRAVNDRERWGIAELSESGEPAQTVMTHRFDFSVNEESDLREVAELFIERLGIKDYSLNINFK
jgi:hypothetical protein